MSVFNSYKYDILTPVFALMLISQLLNNNYTILIASWLNIGKLFIAIFMMCGIIRLLSGHKKPSQSEIYLLFLIYLYLISQIISVYFSLDNFLAIKSLLTFGLQFILIFILIFTWRFEWIDTSLNSLILLFFIISFVNLLNAYAPGFDFFRVRDAVGRNFYLYQFDAKRVVSFTNVYAQFASFLFMGGFLALDKITTYYSNKKLMLNTFFVLFCVLLLFCATMSLQSRSAILALSMSLIFYFFIKSSKKNKLFILLTVGWFIFVFGPFIWNKLISIRASTYYGRINAFSDAICLISDRFWGVGWGGFRELTNMGTVLHNSFLAAFVSGGHIAGITFLLIILYPFYSLLKYRNNNRFLINGFLSGYLANIFLLLSYNGITEYQYFIYPVIACKILEQIKNTPKITIHSH